MQGRGHSVVPAPGTLGSGAVAVRDKMRSLHIGKKEEREIEDQDAVNVRVCLFILSAIIFSARLLQA